MVNTLIDRVFNFICDLIVCFRMQINEKGLVNQINVLSLRQSVSTVLTDIPFGRHRKTQSAYIFQKKIAQECF